MISSSGAEVWKIDPSDGSLFVVVRRASSSVDDPTRARLEAPYRELKVEVTAAHLSAAMKGTSREVYKSGAHVWQAHLVRALLLNSQRRMTYPRGRGFLISECNAA